MSGVTVGREAPPSVLRLDPDALIGWVEDVLRLAGVADSAAAATAQGFVSANRRGLTCPRP